MSFGQWLFSMDRRVAASSTTLNDALTSVARALVRTSYICGIAMRVRTLTIIMIVTASTIVKPRRRFVSIS